MQKNNNQQEELSELELSLRSMEILLKFHQQNLELSSQNVLMMILI